MARSRIAHEVDEVEIMENAKNERVRIFAQNLNALLYKKHIHQDDFAEAIGISTGILSRYRRGLAEPKVSTLIKMAEYLKVDCHYLMTGKKAKNADLSKNIGLSDKAIEFLHKESRHNPMYWRMDMLNFLLEHETFPQLLNFLVGYATATGNRLHDVPSTNGIAPIVTDKDIFKAKINDLINLIVLDTPKLFKNRPDYRMIYESYLAAYQDERFDESGYTLDDIKKEMEANGLIFNAEIFMKKGE